MTDRPVDIEFLAKALGEIVNAEGFEPVVRILDVVLRLELTEPDGTITLALTETSVDRVEVGETDLRPDAVAAMSAQTASRWLAGELNVFLAVDQGLLKITGRSDAVVTVFPQLRQMAAPLYRARLRGPQPTDFVAGVTRLPASLDLQRGGSDAEERSADSREGET